MKSKLKYLSWIFAILTSLTLTGCSKYKDSQFVGHWSESTDLGPLGNKSTDLKLYEDKSCELNLLGFMQMRGQWSVDQDTLLLTMHSTNQPGSSPTTSKFIIVRLNDKEMFLKAPHNDNSISEYKKVRD